MNLIDLIEHEFRNSEVAIEDVWHELESYLQDIWDTRPQAINADEDDSYQENDECDNRTQRYLRWEGKGKLRAGRYVGTVRFGDLTINVWPQVFGEAFTNMPSNGPDCDAALKSCRTYATLNILRWVSRANYFGLASTIAGSDPPNDISSWFEAYIWLFARFTRELLQEQPYWQYNTEVEESGVIRGHLLINPYISECLSRGRWHRLVCEHEPFVFDNLCNRIIKRTCIVALPHCQSERVIEELDRILFELEEVEDCPCSARDCDMVHLNRMLDKYRIVLDNCRMILSSCQSGPSGGGMIRFCFLLPMYSLFEAYLAALACEQEIESTQSRAWRFERGAESCWLTKRFDGHASIEYGGTDCFQIRNDFLWQHDGLPCIIGDAKWKDRRRATQSEVKDPSHVDIYQMVAYGYRRGASSMHLFYPAMKGGSTEIEPVATYRITPGIASDNKPLEIQVHEMRIDSNKPEECAWQNLEKDIKNKFESILMYNVGCTEK